MKTLAGVGSELACFLFSRKKCCEENNKKGHENILKGSKNVPYLNVYVKQIHRCTNAIFLLI